MKYGLEIIVGKSMLFCQLCQGKEVGVNLCPLSKEVLSSFMKVLQ